MLTISSLRGLIVAVAAVVAAVVAVADCLSSCSNWETKEANELLI